MIRKLQIKFVAMCMILVTAVLGVVFTAVFFSAKQNIEVISHQVLQRVMEDDTPSGRPDLGLNRGGEDVLLPYFTVNLWDRSGIYEAFVTGGTYSNLQDTQELQTILTDCLQQNRPEGTIHSYGLRYLRRDYGLYERIAFVDMSMEQATLQEIMGSYLQIGLAALLLLLGVSILLARWATRPVAKAWQQQRQFLSDASHELKTPLTVILSNAELLEAAPLEDRPARWADNIRSEAGQMKSLVEEMLTLARADNMPRTAVHTAQSLTDIVTDTVLSFEPVAFEAGKTLTSRIADGVEVEGDGDKLRRLAGVLLDNAVKYADEGTTVEVKLEKADRRARLTVVNRCAPIPPEQLRRLFERFYRADASRGEKSGFGLGLSIAASIVEEHKGTIKAESDDLSTRFIVTLPLKKA